MKDNYPKEWQCNPYMKIAIALVSYHFNEKEEDFKQKVLELEKQLDKDGKPECAGYVCALLNPHLSFVPQEEKE